MSEETSNSVRWITVAEAAVLFKVKPTTIVSRIEKGTINAQIPENRPLTDDGHTNFLIALESLPYKLQYKYLLSKLPPEELCAVDITSPRTTLGKVWEKQFINTASIIKDAAFIKSYYKDSQTVTLHLRKLAESNGISLSTLYRLLNRKAVKEISTLYTDPVYLLRHMPHTMCLWSCDFTYAMHFDSDHHFSHTDIFKKLAAIQQQASCIDCPYHPDNSADYCSEPSAICPKPGTYMIIPNSRRTISRLLSHIPSQMTLYARRGYREWLSECGLFLKRERPLYINENWQGDHHKLNIFIRITITRNHNGRTYNKEIAIRPTLTAWMDSASGCIVGWVISVMPNSDTIAEAFSRAAVITPGVPFHGLPASVIVDCGKDYRSQLLEENPYPDSLVSANPEVFLNRRFSGSGLLPALGVEVHHALPYHPQTKSIERFFGTLESCWISKLDGWCYSNNSDRPQGFQKKLDKMLQEHKLMTLEQFTEYFSEIILPAYHGLIDEIPAKLNSTEWSLSEKSLSPMQKYQTFPRFRSVTPDWQTISILKMHHSCDHKIGRWGIRFRNVYYQSDELAYYVNDKVDILYNDVHKPYSPASISVIHNGKFLCEAFPSSNHPYIGANKIDLSVHADSQQAPAREYHSHISRIMKSAESILPEVQREDHLNQLCKAELYDECYTQAVFDKNDANLSATDNYSYTPDDYHINDNTSSDIVRNGLKFMFGE